MYDSAAMCVPITRCRSIGVVPLSFGGSEGDVYVYLCYDDRTKGYHGFSCASLFHKVDGGNCLRVDIGCGLSKKNLPLLSIV